MSFKSPARQKREALLDKVLAPLTQAEREALRMAFISGISKSDIEALLDDIGLNDVVKFQNTVTGGIGIIGPNGEQIAGNAAPYAFTSRVLADTDNGMNLVCATAQTAAVDADLPAGFGCSFEGAISFTAGAGVTITDLRTTGATDVFCGLMQVGANTYKVRGGKA